MIPTKYAWSKSFKSISVSDADTTADADINSSADPCSTSPEKDISKIVCNNICGNLLLSDQDSKLEIWRKSNVQDATVTIAVFNSAMNTSSIKVIVRRTGGSPVKFTVPPGNTLSATVEDAKSISVLRRGSGITEGKFCLDVCFDLRHGEYVV
ncbi:S-Ena type endospore appendage [Neobacillus drentensis]|uniref:S-Ena type endospore appendage n=1 Tax=Neobacillus drentensis TaxID=220684 RepID=UPI003B587E42